MRAIEFDGEIKIHNDFPKPEPDKGEALIKINMAGICNTDLEITKGYMGFSGILGHEFVGVVEKINGDNQELVGKRVVGEINCGCGACECCSSGLQNHCPERNVLGILNRNGCFADYITLPVNNLVEIPDSVSDEEAVLVEPLAAAFEIITQIYLKPSDKVLILGDGKLGLLIALVLKLSPSKIILVGKHEEKLKIAKNQGVETVLFNDLEHKRDYDVVVDATGSAGGFELALKLVKPRGAVVLKSTVAENKDINLSPLVIDEILLVGSRCGPFKPAIKALEKKLIDVKPLISKIFSFDQAKEAFEINKTKEVLKVLIDFRG
ncbi:MAG: alcohol dehydrogenase GroES protein [uncultured bacterium]|nr:MAG: alcohol dehydrogenase GroES protein [uncultured bacterium]HBH17543.1 alcohol dehydrogenase [Cyanobacteria bacterium UBA9579]